MKKFLLSALIVFSLSSFTMVTFAQVVSAIKSGNSSEVAKYFDKSVELTLPGHSSSFSKSQANMVLQDFFNQNPVKSFEVIHQSEKPGSEYCIGNLVTSNGDFRTTIYIKEVHSRQLIQELRFEK